MVIRLYVMANKGFSYVILASFALGTFLLIFVLYNSTRNTNKLIRGNAELLQELKLSDHLRVIDRDILSAESRIRAAIATNDTSQLQGVEDKIGLVSIYLDSLAQNNADPKVTPFINRLTVLAREKVTIKDYLIRRSLALGNMNDISLIANPHARLLSNEIAVAISKIYDSRQKLMIKLSAGINEDIHISRVYRDVLIALLFLWAAVIRFLIISHLRRQNQLILKLDLSEKKAQEAAQVKENFLANMSHEIRTPLNAILGFTNLLKRRKLDNESVEFIDTIQSAGKNLLAIINDILDLSKIDGGMMHIVHAPFSVSGLLHSIEILFSERIKDKGLVFYSKIDQGVPNTLVGDASRLTQILVNLIGNAVKFSEHGEIRVEIYSKLITGSSIQLGFNVADSGIGIDKDKLSAIFERFNQAEDSITRTYGGTGLGLSIVKELILLQGGDITVKSELGKGTEFQFYITYTIAEEQITDTPNHSADRYKNKINASVNILVVDDNVMNQSLMKHLLTQVNANCDTASNGIEAINLLKAKKYDLVLMDIQMPGMDGYTATQQIRTGLGSDVPIIAMTAHAMAGEREKCISYGMNEYISKPINEHELFAKIGRLITQKPSTEIARVGHIPTYSTIDLTYMKEISKGNTAYEKTVTSQFIQSIPSDISGLKQALDTDDIPSLNHIAHNMKTSVAIMGLLPALEDILETMEAARGGGPGISSLINELNVICQEALREANDFYESLNRP